MKSFHSRTPRATPTPPRPRLAPTLTGHRADQMLVAQGLAQSRTAAQRLIEAGRVSWRGSRGIEPVAKPSQPLPEGADILVAAGDTDRYVSRGGLKLAGALAHTGCEVRGKTCLDVGQSTGGFTDCLLQAGAVRVVGVDVGHGQLHARLRNDPRIACIEGVNARALDAATLGGNFPPRGFDLIVGDVSFISLTLLLPQLPPLLATGGELLLLVKPQFEVGPAHVGKGGIVRDAALFSQVAAKLHDACTSAHLAVRDWFESPIAGGDGNREFFIWANHEQT